MAQRFSEKTCLFHASRPIYPTAIRQKIGHPNDSQSSSRVKAQILNPNLGDLTSVCFVTLLVFQFWNIFGGWVWGIDEAYIDKTINVHHLVSVIGVAIFMFPFASRSGIIYVGLFEATTVVYYIMAPFKDEGVFEKGSRLFWSFIFPQ